jgi:hypothetical protein
MKTPPKLTFRQKLWSSLESFLLAETKRSRFGEELNVEKMKKAVWLKPEVVAQIEIPRMH